MRCDIAYNCEKQAEARGAEEQRRKDAELSRAELFCKRQKDASDRTEERADVVQWQKDQNEFFLSNVLEIVTEYAAWRDRRDAERQEPVAWIDASELPERENNMACSTASLSPLKSHYETTALYTRPANVAALQAALKAIGDEVLEGAEPFRHAVVRILKTVGIDPLNGAEPEDMEITLKERVEDLERVCRHVVWTGEEHGLGSRGHDSAVQIARSALTREGGE
ncbi:hypothetical protein NBRC3293_2506 [Gluconobacter oxydans NBRC 3293]|uniref:Uncharacterized protein n=1 Tax=Gluconobacter oxydans NBRC 3293 TaxID=1315969 RepID=A0A829X9A4_GLUOY|nr:hypothetical protein NBRC3293_2506 [Gluconobacter oxydans NBRC 3293]